MKKLFVYLYFGVSFLFFETSSHCVAQTDLELTTVLPQPPKCREYRGDHHAQPELQILKQGDVSVLQLKDLHFIIILEVILNEEVCCVLVTACMLRSRTDPN